MAIDAIEHGNVPEGKNGGFSSLGSPFRNSSYFWHIDSPREQPGEESALVGGDWNMTFIFPYIGKNSPN